MPGMTLQLKGNAPCGYQHTLTFILSQPFIFIDSKGPVSGSSLYAWFPLVLTYGGNVCFME